LVRARLCCLCPPLGRGFVGWGGAWGMGGLLVPSFPHRPFPPPLRESAANASSEGFSFGPVRLRVHAFTGRILTDGQGRGAEGRSGRARGAPPGRAAARA